jgi:hypothetical protein
MNQEYFGSWKGVQRKREETLGPSDLVAAFGPFLKTKVPVNHRSNAK